MKPTDSYYAKVGLFMSYPQATSTDNHGLAFGPDPNQNGLFVIGETGFTPKIGAPKSAESNKWAYLQPYIQYIIQPNGTGAIENATILGFMTGITF